MYREHFGLHQAPFSLTPQAACFHEGLHGTTLQAVHTAVRTDQGVLLVRGAFGTGKSMLCHMLVKKLSTEAIVVSTSGEEIERVGLLRMVQNALEIALPDAHAPFRQLERRLCESRYAGKHIVLAIDDAQLMSLPSLEMLNRLCSLHFDGRQAIQFVCFAEKGFRKTLAAGRLRVLRARIARTFDLSALNRRQVADYLQFRLSTAGYSGQAQFPDPLATLITRASRGLLKHINIIADKAMMAAFAENVASVSEIHVKAAIRDTHLPRPRFIDSPALLLGSAGVLLAATTIAWLALKPPHPVPDDSSRPPAAATEAPAPAVSSAAQSAGTAGNTTESVALSVTNRSARFAAIPDQLGPAARARLLASQDSLDAIPENHWFLQLRAIPAANAARLETFLANAEKAIDTRQLILFVARDDPQQTVLVLYGSYPTEQAAYAEIARLPAWIRSKGIQPRAVKPLQQGIAKTTVATGMLSIRHRDLVAAHTNP